MILLLQQFGAEPSIVLVPQGTLLVTVLNRNFDPAKKKGVLAIYCIRNIPRSAIDALYSIVSLSFESGKAIVV
jgi:hypothetical protein